MIERQKHRGGVRAAPAQSPAHGDSLGNPDRRPSPAARRGLQGLSGPYSEVRVRIDPYGTRRTLDPAIVRDAERNRIVQVNELKKRLQLVIAVRATPCDVQKKIQLGRRGPLRLATRH